MSTKVGTTQSYNQIADRFFERNRDRSKIEGNLDQFAQHCKTNDLILDIGCGPGFYGDLLRARGFRVIGLDLSSQMMKIGRRLFPYPFVQADMEILPFLQQIDGLWVNASLLHIEREATPGTLREFCRVLKPGGNLFISVKKGVGARWEPGDEEAPRWFTYWRVEQLSAAVSSEGFQILDIGSDDKWVRCCARKHSD